MGRDPKAKGRRAMGIQDRDWYHESQRKREDGRWWNRARPKAGDMSGARWAGAKWVAWVAIVCLVAWVVIAAGQSRRAPPPISISPRVELVSPARGAVASAVPTFEWKVTR
jgi:hypothetical protein